MGSALNGRSHWGFDDTAARLDVPLLAGEQLAVQGRRHPVRHEYRRERSEVRRRHVADRVTRVLVDHQPLRPSEYRHQPLGVDEWGELLGFAGETEVRRA